MRGLDRDGNPNPNGSSYYYPGDPVARTGDLGEMTTDKKMIGGMGPFTFAPGDSQFVAFVLVIGHGGDRLSSISVMRYYASMINQTPTDVDDNPSGTLPSCFTLRQNYPNPFNPGTQIGYDLQTRGEITIDIFNVLG